ncbi:MAG: RNA polymerase sigma factor [Actinomycetes bacterium]
MGSLWSRIAAGDPQAFERIYGLHADRVHGFAFRRSGSWDLADEITSGVFLEAWRRRGEVDLEPDEAILPWLLGVAANLMRNAGRKQQRYQAFLSAQSPEPSVPDFAEDLAGQLDSQRELELLRLALEHLGDDDRDLLLLCVAEGLTPTEVAIALDMPAGTVRSRLSRARARLRVLLEQLNRGMDGGEER